MSQSILTLSNGKGRPKAFLDWAATVFGSIARSKEERTVRFLEEAIEVAHASGIQIGTVSGLAERVYARPSGHLSRELGQAAVTLEMLAEVNCLSLEDEAATEFERVQSIPIDEWQARHAAKIKLGIAKASPERSAEQ